MDPIGQTQDTVKELHLFVGLGVPGVSYRYSQGSIPPPQKKHKCTLKVLSLQFV